MKTRLKCRTVLVLASVVGMTCGAMSVASATTPATTPGDGSAAPAGAMAPGDFGDLKGVCGPGDATGATDQGVSDTEIVMGTASDPGAVAVPGLNQEIFDAGDAFVAWCNEAGGINGRQIKLNKHDAKLFEAAAAMVEACQTDFMLAGDGMAADMLAAPVRTACGLPQIAAYTVSEIMGRSEGSIEAIPNNDRASHMEPILKTILTKDPEAAKQFALWNLDVPSVTPTGERTAKAAENLGIPAVVYELIPTGVDNWRPYVENLKAKNAQTLVVYGSPPTLIPVLKSMNDVGYFPKYIVLESNYYDHSVINEAGELLGNTTMLLNGYFWPFEDAANNAPTQQLIDIVKKYTGAEIKSLALNSWSAWLLWAQSARDCGSDLTRACVLEKASAVTGWTGGGLHVPTTPGPTTRLSSECYLVRQATPTGFVTSEEFTNANNGIYNCDPANNKQIDGLDP